MTKMNKVKFIILLMVIIGLVMGIVGEIIIASCLLNPKCANQPSLASLSLAETVQVFGLLLELFAILLLVFEEFFVERTAIERK
jgi:hypothetical protein